MAPEIIQKIEEKRWGVSPQPECFKPSRVSEALRSINTATDSAIAKTASSNLRRAVGNDHRGTYYPVLLEILPVLTDILRNGERWSREAVLSFLIDSVHSFEPELGYEEVIAQDGHRVSVEREFKAWFISLRPLLSDMTEQEGASYAAQRLLEVIHGRVG